MTGELPWWETVPIPSLLRSARRTYSTAVRAALVEAGCDDLPRNGAFVLASIRRAGAGLSEIIRELAVSKQAAGQLIDTLVSRGYLDRSVDPQDRRRLVMSLTSRGHAAAEVITAAIGRVDARLRERAGEDQLGQGRALLGALSELGAAADDHEGHEDQGDHAHGG